MSQTTQNVSMAVVTPVGIMSYPNLLEARQYTGGVGGKPKGDPRFEVDLIFEEADLKKFNRPTEGGGFEAIDIQLALRDLWVKRWGDTSGYTTKGWPVKNGNQTAEKKEKAGKKADIYKGKFHLPLKAYDDKPPPLRFRFNGETKTLDRANPEDVKLIKSLFTGGNFGYASVGFKPQEVDGDRYIAAYLNGIQFFRKGKPLGQGSLIDRFDGIHGQDSDYDPTMGMGAGQAAKSAGGGMAAKLDDEIPF